MIFPAPSTNLRPIAPGLFLQAQKIEERSPGLYVLAAREFRYPVQQQEVGVQAERYRKLNLLEKFVLRAYVEITPTPSLEELAGALGLDPIFIRNTFNDLVSLQNINKNLQVTEAGKKSLSSETVSEGSEYDTWYLTQDMVLNIANFSRYPLAEINEENYEDLSSYVQKDLTHFPTLEFQPAALQLQEMGLDFHDPDEGRFVTALEPKGKPELGWKLVAIFVLHDRLNESEEKSVTIQARSEDQSLPIIAEWLTSEIQQQHLSLKTLCGLDEEMFTREEEFQPRENLEEQLVEERLEEIRQQEVYQLRLKTEGRTLEKDAGTAIQLRDIEIRPAFLKALQGAREQIIIYSPWINDQVVDDEFITLMEDLVRKGVHILIGYGIGRDENKEERSIPSYLLQRLRNIQTAEGTPGVITEWLGNSHAKEIIIDGAIHFSGSHNWLSYRGDRFPRGETVYQVTIVTEVEKAHNHLARRFIEHAQVLWSKTTEEERRVAICILCYLGHEQEAVEWLQHDALYHLIPFWLRLARQAIAAAHEARILAPLHTVINLCNTAIEPQDPLRVEIAHALQEMLKIMEAKNQGLVAGFYSDNSSELTQLGMPPP